MMKKIGILLLAALMPAAIPAFSAERAQKSIYHKGWIDFNKNGRKDVYEDPGQPVEKRVADLLSQMTPEEKSCQLATLYGYGRVLRDSLPTARWSSEVWKDGIANIDEQLNGVGRGYKDSYDLIYPFSNHVDALRRIQRWFVEQTRLGIPVEFSNEAIHGLNHTKATPFPAPIAIGSTWNRELVYQAGRIAGMEAALLGYHSIYAPILDVARDPRWGRIVECYGEDPYLIAELGISMAGGIQSEGLVGAGLKHFAAYSIPKGGRDGECRTDPHLSPRELEEMHLYTFRRVIENTHPWIVMSSYNDWNGEPVSASYRFLTEILRDEFGFDGYVVSDSQAVEFVYTKHNVAEDYDDAVRQVLEAGLNVRTHFTPPADFIMPVRRLMESGKIPMDVIDRRVSEVLAVKFRMGLFDSPYRADPAEADKYAGADKHQEFVADMQRQAMVLLKNEGNLLPLDKKALKKVLVTGPLADEDNFMISRYGPNGLPTVTVLDGLKSYIDGSGIEVAYEKGCETVDSRWPESELYPVEITDEEKSMISRAVNAAEESDVIIAVMGEDEYVVGESRSRTSMDLPGRQRDLLMALHATGKPVVLVLVNGRPLTINWENKNLPSILETWFPNYKGGEVIAQTLFGDYNPSGKLTVTFPKSIGQIEYNFPFKKGSHGAQPYYGPNGAGNTRVLGPLYPFGYGLSYTTYAYDNIAVDVKGTAAGGFEVKVSADITNTGSRAGEEIVQLYVRDKVSSVVTYDSILRGFEKIHLNPGETKTVTFTLGEEHLKLLDKNMEWKVESGDFDIMIGASSEDIRLSRTITL